MAKNPNDIISTQLRMPAGLHQLLKDSAARNNRSINSEVLWAIAQHLGEEAQGWVEHMAVEQRRMLQNVLGQLIADPEKARQALANIEERQRPQPPLKKRPLK